MKLFYFSSLIVSILPLVLGRPNSDSPTIVRQAMAESNLNFKFYDSLRVNQEVSLPNLAQEVRLYLGNYGNGRTPNTLEDIGESCSVHIAAWANNLTADWSLQMFDSMSKIPEGFLTGNVYSTGAFDECLQVRAEVELSEPSLDPNFKGKYCSGYLVPGSMCYGDSNQKDQLLSRNEYGLKKFQHARAGFLETAGFYPSLATCFPSSCTIEDINTIFLTILEPTGLCLAVDNCQTDDSPKLRSGDIIMIVILSIMASLCVVGTAIDLFLNYNNGESQQNHSTTIQCVIAFSLYTNIRKWANTKSGGDNLGCIHGIRFLSTCRVVLAHTWSTWFPIRNYADILLIYKDNWTIYPIINGSVAVDTFFTLSAILVAYSVLKMLDKSKGRFNVPMFYLHRYLRLTPTYALLIGIMATWFEYLRLGPFTNALGPEASSCRHNWWHNLLYINNLVKYTDYSSAYCHGESWYLGNDMQFFLISPLLLFPLWKWKAVGMTIMGAFTVASVAVPFTITYVEELDGTSLPFSLNWPRSYEKMYIKPWMRFGPYIVGLWAGYLLHKGRTRRTALKLPKVIVVAGWLISTATALAIIFGFIPYFDPTTEYNRIDHAFAFYGGFHRFAWGGVISWVVLACTMGFGGLINKFLSWKAFIPLGRLTFCTYLISFWLQNLFMFSSRQPIHYDLYTGINLFFAHLVMSLLVSFVATMTLESPFIALEKLIFRRESAPTNKIQKESIENNSNSSNNNSQANLTKP